MLLLFIYYFNNYFPNDNYETSQCLTRFTNLFSNFWINSCLFLNLEKIPSNGGALLLINNNFKIVIEFSSFINCNVDNTFNGGALYIQVLSLILNKICGFNCSTNGQNNFQFGLLETIENYKNNFLYSSICFCSDNFKFQWETIYFKNGIQNLDSINSSNNICYVRSGLYFNNPNPLNAIFITLSENEVSIDTRCLFFQKGNCYMKYSNIIKNKSPNYQIIRNYDNSNSEMYSCFFYNNTCKELFYIDNGVLTIRNCFSDIFSYRLEIPIFINTNYFISQTKIYHFNTFFCKAKNPLIFKSNSLKSYFDFTFYFIYFFNS